MAQIFEADLRLLSLTGQWAGSCMSAVVFLQSVWYIYIATGSLANFDLSVIVLNCSVSAMVEAYTVVPAGAAR